MYIKSRANGTNNGDSNANALLNWTMIIFVGISVLGWFFSSAFVPFIYGNMSAATEVLAVEMTQIFFAFMTMIALSGLLDSYLQSRRNFRAITSGKTTCDINGSIFALFFSDIWGIFSLVYGFIAGTVMGVLIQLFFLVRSDYKWQPVFRMEREFKIAFLALIVPSLLNSVCGASEFIREPVLRLRYWRCFRYISE